MSQTGEGPESLPATTAEPELEPEPGAAQEAGAPADGAEVPGAAETDGRPDAADAPDAADVTVADAADAGITGTGITGTGVTGTGVTGTGVTGTGVTGTGTTGVARPRRWRRVTAIAVLIILGLGGTAGGATALDKELTRYATPAEATAAGHQEQASLWQRLTAGQIFPRTVGYVTAAGASETATLVGIASPASCASSADAAVAQALAKAGCETMLRATYVDPSGTVLATVGVAVLRSPGAAQQAYDTFGSNNTAGVRAVAFPGTASAAFTDAAREMFGSNFGGPYVFFYTVGYADGRTTTVETGAGETATEDLGTGVMTYLAQAFSAPAKPCSNRYIAC